MDDRLQLSIESNTEKLVNSIEMLVSEMKTLKTAVSSTIPSLSSYSKQFNSMNTATKSLKGSMNMVAQEMESMKTKSQQGADSLKSLSKEFRGLGDTQTANYLKQIANNIDEVSKSDARSKVAELSSSLKGIVDESVITKLDKVAMGIKNIKVYGDTKKIADIKLSSDVPSSFDKATVSIKKMNAEIEETNSKGSKFKQTMGSIANSLDQITKFAKISALFYTLKQGLEVINSFIRKSVSFTETLNLFNVAMGNSTDKAQQFINTMSSNFGLDPDTLMRYMGTFNLMADSMGLSEKNAYTLSETMTKLGVDMASLYNIPIEEAMNKLRAGISGETEPLRQLGIDVTEATIRMEAMRQGIDKTTNEMTYAEKSQLRYLAILRQTTSAQGDFARTMNSPANQLKILKEQFALLSREIGNIFIPILNKILPYVIAVVMVLQDMAKAIASFFGFELPKVDYSSIKTGASDVAGAYDEVGDSATNASKKVKEFQKQLLGVDELNVIQPPSKDSGSSGSGAGAGTSGAGFDLDLPGYDNLMDSVTNQAKELKKQVEPLVKVLLGLVGVFLALKGVLKLFELGSLINNSKLLAPLVEALSSSFSSLLGALGLSSGALLLIVGLIATFIAIVVDAYKNNEEFRKSVDTLANNIMKVLSPAFKVMGDILSATVDALLWFFNALKVNAVTRLGIQIDAINGAFATLSKLLQGDFKSAFKEVQSTLGNMFDKLKQGAREILPATKQIDVFKDVSKETTKALKPLVSEFNNLDKNLNKIDWSNKIVSEKDINDAKKRLDKITSEVKKTLEKNKNDSIKTLNEMAKSGYINESELNALLEKTNKVYEKEVSNQEEIKNKILQIQTNAKNERRTLKESEVNEISALQEQLKTNTVETLSKSEEEANLILGRMTQNAKNLSVDQASSIISDSIKTRDETIKNAQDRYTKEIEELDKLKEAGIINDEQYKKMREASTNTRDETIKNAEETHEKTYAEFEKQNKDIAKYIDEDSGGVKSNLEVMWEDMSTPVVEWATNTYDTWSRGWNAIINWWNTNVAPWFTVAKWQEVFNNIGKGISNAIGWCLGEMKKFINGVFIDPLNGVLNWINDKLKISFKKIELDVLGKKIKIWDGFSKQLFTLPTIPRLARGGIVDKATPLIAGEAGKEAIVPLENTSFVTTLANAIANAIGEKINIPNNSYSNQAIYIDKDILVGVIKDTLNNDTGNFGSNQFDFRIG